MNRQPSHPWIKLAFPSEGLERAFAAHYGRRQEKVDLAALAVLVLGLVLAAAMHMQATWPAGVAAMLLFAPYFFDARLYLNFRDGLLSAALLSSAVFLASLGPPALHVNGSKTCDSRGPHDTSTLMAGFGICWFVVHTCGLDFLLAAPMLLRMRMSRMLPVQAISLALALWRLPATYESVLGRLDTVHVLLLGLLLIAGALAGLAIAHALERQHRQLWLARRVRRGEGMSSAAANNALPSPGRA